MTTAGGYSRAFERFVEDDEDEVGLLAYALFKQAVRETVLAKGVAASPAGQRDPAATEIRTYRLAAEQMLGIVVSRTIEAQRDDLQRSATLDAVEKAVVGLREHVTRRTDFTSALFVNLVAWVVTLALTVLIIWSLGKPDAPKTIVDRVDAAAGTLNGNPTR